MYDCTPNQRKVLDAIIFYGGAKKADEVLGMYKGGASEIYNNVKNKAAKMGYALSMTSSASARMGMSPRGVHLL